MIFEKILILKFEKSREKKFNGPSNKWDLEKLFYEEKKSPVKLTLHCLFKRADLECVDTHALLRLKIAR